MLNIHTHRVTDLADAEAWADARQPARYMHTQPVVYARPYIAMGLDDQGRRPDRIPQPAADSAEGSAGDDGSDFAEFDRPMPGLRSSLLIAIGFLGYTWRWFALALVVVGALVAVALGA